MIKYIQPILIVFVLIITVSCHTKGNSGKNDNTLNFETKADSLSKAFIILDGHVDLPYRMKKKGFMITKTVEDVSVETSGNFDYPKAKRGGLDAPFMSIYVPASYQKSGGAFQFADSLISMMNRLPEKFPDMFAMAYSPADVIANFENGLISLPLGMENGAPIEDDLKNLKYFFDRGIRYITLTHSKDNQICDSSYDDTFTWNGLSAFGEKVIAEMNRLGIMVDISHITDSAAFDALRLSKAPVIASHSSCRKFTPGWHRNMPDTLIKALAAKGGVIHINFGSDFLSKEVSDNRDIMDSVLTNYKATNNLSSTDSAYIAYSKKYAEENEVFADIEIVADHIDHVVSLVGVNHVGFGSDYDGVGDSLPKGMKDVSTYPSLIKELLERGYSSEEIEKICYKNTFRVWNEVINIARQLQEEST